MFKQSIYFVCFVFVAGLGGNATAQVDIDPATVENGHVYLLEEVIDSTVPDDSANDNTGNVLGDPQLVDSLRGKGLQLDGVDDGVHLPDADGINTSTHQNHSVIAVFKCADVTKPEKQCVYEEGGSTRGLTIYVHEGLVWAGAWNRADYTPQWNPGTFISAPISSDQWVTVVAVLRDAGPGQEGDKFEMWMDGELIGVGPGGQLQGRSDDNGVGNVQGQTVFHDSVADAGYWFEGVIDEIWILNEAVGTVPIALGPAPPDGGLHDESSVTLTWRPSGLAVTQDVYLADNFDDVSTGAESAFFASLNRNAVGVSVGGLAAETTYYWRVDTIDDSDPESPWVGDVWSFSLPSQSAFGPSPADGELFVNPGVTLSWSRGVDAVTHTVYLGDNFDDVNDATGGVAQTEPNFTPEEPLALGTVYYWRVDEFDGENTYEGDIWSFETPPFVEVADPNLVGWWKLDGEFADLGYVFDYSGYNHHGSIQGDPQLIEGYVGGAMEFDGEDDFINIDGYKGINATDGVQQPFSVANWFRIAPGESDGNVEMVTWGTSAGRQRLTWRVHQGRLRTEHASGNLRGNTYVDDNEWHHGALVVTEGANLRVPATKLYVDGSEDTTFSGSDNTYNLTAGADVRLGMSGPQNSRYWPGALDDVRIYDKVLSDIDVKIISGFTMSTNPEPADGAKIVDTLAILTWSPGPFAAEFDVYFGTNPEPGENELVGRVAEATHFVTDLAQGQTYYWRIDDVAADGTITPGSVWSFWVPPQGAYNPSPADGAEITDTDADLSWEADWNPVMYVVHFGTNVDDVTNAEAGSGPPIMDIGYDPGTLEPGTYYWRVDTFYGTWVAGPVLSFTVAEPEPPVE
jgi:hypothetical protein